MREFRCKSCHKLLFKYYDSPGTSDSNVNIWHKTKIECKCSKCNTMNTADIPTYSNSSIVKELESSLK